MTFNPSGIPEFLKLRPRWVGWRYLMREGKVTKPPVSIRTGAIDNAHDRTQHVDFEMALAALEVGNLHLDGIGFVLVPEDQLVVVDFDHVREEDGGIADWAMRYLRLLDSYTEISPSGTGVHVWARGTLPPGGRKKGQVEMYSEGRYMTVTGRRL
jgi:putative DNA primase/helicase